MLIQDSTLSDKEEDQLEKMMEEILRRNPKQVEEALEEIIQKLDQIDQKGDAKQIEKVKNWREGRKKKDVVVEEGSRDLRDKIEDLKSAFTGRDLLENKTGENQAARQSRIY
jgi:hypothetical protein